MAPSGRRLLLGACLLGLAAALPAPDSDEAPELTAEITIDNFTFSPAELEVPAGTRVTWTNRDDIPHTIMDGADPRRMRSEPLDTDDRFAFTFATPGTYRYFCSLHPHMQGTVVVR